MSYKIQGLPKNTPKSLVMDKEEAAELPSRHKRATWFMDVLADILSAGLTAAEQRVLAALLTHTKKWNAVYAPQRVIAEAAGVGQGTVSKACRRLIELNVITRSEAHCWMFNPHLFWNWRLSERQQGIVVYNKHRNREKAKGVRHAHQD